MRERLSSNSPSTKASFRKRRTAGPPRRSGKNGRSTARVRPSLPGGCDSGPLQAKGYPRQRFLPAGAVSDFLTSMSGRYETPKLLSGGNSQIAKGYGDAPVRSYIASMPGWKSDIGRRIDGIVGQIVPGVRKAVKWNSPFYGVEDDCWFLSLHCFTKIREGHVFPWHLARSGAARQVEALRSALPRYIRRPVR